MDLVSGYISDSEVETDLDKQHVESTTTVNDDESLKRPSKIKKSDLKRRRLQRKGKGPWGSWSSSDEDSSDDVKDGMSESNGMPQFNSRGIKGLQLPTDLENIIEYDGNHESGNTSVNISEEEMETFTLYDTNYSYNGKKKHSFLSPLKDIGLDLYKPSMSFKCYLPKKIIHTFNGHCDGCNTMSFLPQTGHLFISGGNDDIIKLWNFYGDRKCIQDYRGHSKAIKALKFINEGSKFLSSSFDQSVKVWDTETGKVTKRLKFRALPNSIDSRPMGNGNEFIVGLSNSKIMHYDLRVSEKDGLVQQYDHHLAGILALRYFPDGSKFISSSEDKTVRIWNNQINIPIKQISDTTQHSMPFIDIHPSEKYFCTQSMDNSIYSYSMKPKYKRHSNKIFRGQKSSGFGIGLTFSPDGHYICSGDIRSKILVWDWTTTKLLKTISVPGKKPITQVLWHPQETSKILCTGISGEIYMLD